jgi:hypothetical protein
MVPLVKGAAVIPPAEAAKPMVLDEMKKLGNERRDNSGWI